MWDEENHESVGPGRGIKFVWGGYCENFLRSFTCNDKSEKLLGALALFSGSEFI